MTSHKDRNQTGISTIPIINVDSVAWTDACPNCHIAWKRHLVWRDKQQVLWDPLSPIWMYLGERSATPVCELHNGHLANILNMLTKKIVAGNRQHEPMRDALITEARRRGWDNLDRWTKGPKVLENSL